jgi:hypothetical protein
MALIRHSGDVRRRLRRGRGDASPQEGRDGQADLPLELVEQSGEQRRFSPSGRDQRRQAAPMMKPRPMAIASMV